MNSGIEGNSYGAVISPIRLTYKIGQGSAQVMRDAVLIGTNDDEVNYGSTQTATDLILQIPMMYNNGLCIGSGALSLQVPDGTAKGGNARGIGAVDLQTSRNNATQVASGQYGLLSGINNILSGTYGLVSGWTNTVSGNHSLCTGNSNTINVGNAGAAIGESLTVSGSYAVAIGRYGNANSNYSFVSGNSGTSNGVLVKNVHGSGSGYQSGEVNIWKVTTDATQSILSVLGSTVDATTQCTLQNNNAIAFTVEVVARNTSTGMAGRWETKGLIKRGANASSTALVGTPTITLTNGDNEAWIVAGAIAITADTINGALAIAATGAASTTIHWIAKILTTEVI
jgi:hypothetical protein